LFILFFFSKKEYKFFLFLLFVSFFFRKKESKENMVFCSAKIKKATKKRIIKKFLLNRYKTIKKLEYKIIQKKCLSPFVFFLSSFFLKKKREKVKAKEKTRKIILYIL
jgi:hypothetical protein